MRLRRRAQRLSEPGLRAATAALASGTARAAQAAERAADGAGAAWSEWLDRLGASSVVDATGAVWVGLAAAALSAAALWTLLRPRGDLRVSIDYPAELDARFRVRIARYRRRPRPRRAFRHEEILRGGLSTRRVHHQVVRETRFRRLPARRYFVHVEGVLRDPKSGEVLFDAAERKLATVSRRRPAELSFEIVPGGCPLEVEVLWDGRPAPDAAVAVRGQPESVTRSEGDPVRLLLAPGRHVIRIGAADRVVEREVEARSPALEGISVDVHGASELVFKGCPPAVEPYLRGDLEAAARCLDCDGQPAEAQLLLARFHARQGEDALAARCFAEAGLPLEAAELLARQRDFTRAGELFEEAGEHARAAEMYFAAGQWSRAGAAHERAGDTDDAILCYRAAGEVHHWIDALERRGELFAAARVALENASEARGIQLLRRIGPEDDHFADACTLLADAFAREGHYDLAAQKLEEHVHALGSRCSSDARARLVDLLEQAGNPHDALAALEELRRRDPLYPNLATRLESLRKQLSGRLSGPGAGGDSLGVTRFLAASRYELLGEIGRGGMGVVYRARDQRLDRIVALKRLPEGLRDHPKAVRLFLREAQAAARLNHPNIVTVFDADQEDGVFFITMELLEGEPVTAFLRRRERLSAPEVAEIGSQVASGLAYAHRHGIVHRDVKTANLFLSGPLEAPVAERVVKIMDFGLAKILAEVKGAASVVGGTPYYMAPEQTAGADVDHRADLYSLGVTLFELATGRVPFEDGDVAYHNRHTPPPDPRTLVPELPEALAALVLELLAKQPEARGPGAHEVRQRLQRLASP